MNRLSFLRLVLAAALAFSLFSGAAPAPVMAGNQIQSTFTVNNNGDAEDLNPGDGVCTTISPGNICTLRAAIQEVNAKFTDAPHTIAFSSNYTISVSSNLPTLTRNFTTLNAVGHTVTIQPVLGSPTTRGLEISASNVSIQGLTVSGFGKNILISGGSDSLIGVSSSAAERNIIINATQNAIEVTGSGQWNRISGNYIGLDPAGNPHANAGCGVLVSAKNTIIGTSGNGINDNMEGNVISGNGDYGIDIADNGDGAIIGGNIIGLKGDGLTALPNGLGGILVFQADGVTIGADGDGTSDDLQANVISGNLNFGIYLSESHGDKISGNIIGLSSDGASARGNENYGIWVGNTAYDITIGVDESNPTYSTAERNVIAASPSGGIFLQGYQTTIAGNYIGTDKTGSSSRPNVLAGISISGNKNTIGTDGDGLADAYEGNLISGNTQQGITIAGPTAENNVIAGNIIGLNAAGSTALGNGYNGITIQNSAPGTRIGTDGNGVSDTYERNVISSNGYHGISIYNSGEAVISGNYIGTDKLGISDLGNTRSGISVDSATQTVTIGIPTGGIASQSNVISGNGYNGIHMNNIDSSIIAGNYIGVDMNGGNPIANDLNGIRIENSQNTRIGTDSDTKSDGLEKNQISGNGNYGISVEGAATDKTLIAGNWIGLDYDGAAAIPNQFGGILVINDAANTRIGTDGDKILDEIEGNVISGNNQSGIYLTNQSGTIIAGNVIGLSASHTGGSIAVPNSGKGIWISGGMKSELSAVNPVRIGTNADGRSDDYETNIISGNSQSGIYITGGAGHIIAGNYIGVDWDGKSAIPNGDNGVYIVNGAGTGTRIGTNGDGVYDTAERNIISGNTGYGVRLDGNANFVAGNYIGTDSSGILACPNSLGGVWLLDSDSNKVGMDSNNSAGEANEGNLISGNNGPGVVISSGALSMVAGNRIGSNAAGTGALPNLVAGVRLAASPGGNTIGSNDDGINDALEGNLISGNSGSGVQIMGPTSSITSLYGNTIGLGGDKLTPLPNTADGIYIEYGNGIHIGDTASASQANIISGNTGHGITMQGTASDVRIIGNRIGLSASGTAAGNGGHGVRISTQYAKAKQTAYAANSAVDPCQAVKACVLSNQIFFNSGIGVFVDFLASTGYQIMSNSFYANGGLGIDLFPIGVTANDAGDPDLGANGLQNFPIVESVSFPSGTTARVTGSFNSSPSTTFTIQLYAAINNDPSTFGEGLDPIYSFTLATDGSGAASFDRTFAYLLGTSRSYFSAIALAPDWSTSEFGPNLHLAFLDIYTYLPVIAR
jgi:parallel beta-helix repeat protein